MCITNLIKIIFFAQKIWRCRKIKSLIIKLNSLEKIKKFTEIMALCKYECRLISKEYIIDAKSLSGIISLDLTNKLRLEIDDTDFDKIKESLKFFLT